MEINSKAWTADNLEPFSAITYVNSVAATDPIMAINCAYGRLMERLTKDRTVQRSLTTYSMGPGEFDFIVNGVKEKALKEGRKEAWDLARRIVAGDCSDAYNIDEVHKVFDKSSWNVLKMPVEEVLAKDKEYQEEKEALHVGDEVKFRSTGMVCGYVVDTKMSEFVTVLMKDRSTNILRISNLAKTGNVNEDLVKALAVFDE